MPITFHLRDHNVSVSNYTPNPATTAFPALLTTGLLQHGELPLYDASCAADDVRDRAGSNHLFFVHTSNPTSWVDAMTRIPPALGGHVVFASSLGATSIPPGAPAGRCHACHWMPDDFENPPARLKRWIEQIQTLEITQIDWDLLYPVDTDALLAMKILCQAYELEKAGGLNPNFSAPAGHVEWCEPFPPAERDQLFAQSPSSSRTIKDASAACLNFLNDPAQPSAPADVTALLGKIESALADASK